MRKLKFCKPVKGTICDVCADPADVMWEIEGSWPEWLCLVHARQMARGIERVLAKAKKRSKLV